MHNTYFTTAFASRGLDPVVHASIAAAFPGVTIHQKANYFGYDLVYSCCGGCGKPFDESGKPGTIRPSPWHYLLTCNGDTNGWEVCGKPRYWVRYISEQDRIEVGRAGKFFDLVEIKVRGLIHDAKEDLRKEKTPDADDPLILKLVKEMYKKCWESFYPPKDYVLILQPERFREFSDYLDGLPGARSGLISDGEGGFETLRYKNMEILSRRDALGDRIEKKADLAPHGGAIVAAAMIEQSRPDSTKATIGGWDLDTKEASLKKHRENHEEMWRRLQGLQSLGPTIINQQVYWEEMERLHKKTKFDYGHRSAMEIKHLDPWTGGPLQGEDTCQGGVSENAVINVFSSMDRAARKHKVLAVPDGFLPPKEVPWYRHGSPSVTSRLRSWLKLRRSVSECSCKYTTVANGRREYSGLDHLGCVGSGSDKVRA